MGGIKKTIQSVLINKAHRKYKKELLRAGEGYEIYAEAMRKSLAEKYSANGSKMIPQILTETEVPAFAARLKHLSADDSKFVIFTTDRSVLSPVAGDVFASFFEENEDACVCYADEDRYPMPDMPPKFNGLPPMDESSLKFANLCNPFFKPVPSFETLLSERYTGNIVAIRLNTLISYGLDEALTVFEKPADGDGESAGKSVDELLTARRMLYDFELRLFGKEGEKAFVHVPYILMHTLCVPGTENDEYIYGAEPEYDDLKTAYRDNSFTGLISVVIPSKDHPEVLQNCVSSMRELTGYSNYEIIVVDNGSNDANRELTEEMSRKYDFKYVFYPEEFNFSRMCNRGVKAANGEIILLLNDDIVITDAEWMERMASYASKEEIGAVGLKLLYPDGDLIQHVGITNAVDGPVHKFIGQSDSINYYHGRNRVDHNCIAVTGACLMVRKSLYDSVGGLDENLRVAYNDVDLCYSLAGKGLRNVVVCSASAVHCESVSRGNDALDKVKMDRLVSERSFLYEKHPKYYHFDPYEGAMNAGGSSLDLSLSAVDAGSNEVKFSPTSKKFDELPSGIHVSLDRAEKEPGEMGSETSYAVEGFLVVPEADNARYSFTMVLKSETKVYAAALKKQMRQNIADGFPKASNLELCGFGARIVKGDVEPGRYEIGFYAADSCSRQRLFNATGQFLEIE